jgi:hypothetical protein
MRKQWTLGTVITVSFLVLGWLFTRSFQVSEAAVSRADKAAAAATQAHELAKETRIILDEHIKAQDEIFKRLDEREQERHEAVLGAIRDLRQDMREKK